MRTLSQFILATFLLINSTLIGQEDLLSLVDDGKDQKSQKVFATFKTYRLGNAQTTETVKKKHLDFRISHRFGNLYDKTINNPINQTFQSFMGFDNVSDISNILKKSIIGNNLIVFIYKNFCFFFLYSIIVCIYFEAF
jgi:hypothetical protein